VLLRALPLLCLAACHGGAAPAGTCPSFIAGDLAQPVSLQPFNSLSGAVINDGDTVPLTRPQQGGYVIFVGARVRNLRACGLTASAELIDRTTGTAATDLDRRQGDFTEAVAGYFQSPVGDGEPNIPACPNNLGETIAGKEATLHITVTDAEGRSGVVERRVTPTCSAGDSTCASLCGPR
jgi:hypothetical protein